MKKPVAIAVILIGALLLLLSGFLIINGVQRDQAYKTVRTFSLESDKLQGLSDKPVARKTVNCRPEGTKMYGKCQAAEYTVTPEMCITLVQRFKPNAADCNAEIDVTYRNNHIKIIAGSLYGNDQRQFQVILNEPHLLSAWK